MAAQLVITVIPQDEFGNRLTGENIRLRKTGVDHNDPTPVYPNGTVGLVCTEIGTTGVYQYVSVDDDIESHYTDVLTSDLGNYEIWTYTGSTPLTIRFGNYFGGASLGILLALKGLYDGKSDISHVHDADTVNIDDVGTYFTGTEVEAALQEIGAELASPTHNHIEVDITDLDKYTQTEADTLLAAKAAVSHAHTTSDISDYDEDLPIPIPPLQFIVSTTEEVINGTGVVDSTKLSVPIVQGLINTDLMIKISLGGYFTNCSSTGSSVVIGDVSSYPYISADDTLNDGFCRINGVVYRILDSAVVVNGGTIMTLTVDGTPGSLSNQDVEVWTGEFYELIAIPKYTGTDNEDKARRFIFPILVDGVYRHEFYVPLESQRAYRFETRTIRRGKRSSARVIASQTIDVTQEATVEGNFTISSQEFGITVSISATGGWVNATAFEICWATGGGAADFTNNDHRKAITYSRTFDIAMSESTYVSVSVRPLLNGSVLAPAYTKSTVAGAGGALPNEKSLHVDVDLTTTDITQAARTVLQKAFRNPIEIVQATFVATGTSTDTSKARVFQSNLVSNIASTTFNDTASENVQYSPQWELELQIQSGVFEITFDFFDPVGSNNFDTHGRLEIFYRDVSAKIRTYRAITVD